MTKRSKLEEYGLLDEARKLKDSGMGLHEIRNVLMTNHPDVEGGLSHMAVKRGLLVKEDKTVELQIKEGKNPIEEFDKELREKVEENTNKLAELEEKANKVLDDAMQTDSISDKTKALKEVRETLSQVMKNQVILQQFCNQRVSSLDKEAFKQKEQIKVLLVKWITVIEEELCPKCKERSIPKVIKLVESEEV